MGCCGNEGKGKSLRHIIQLIILNQNKRVKKKVNQQGIQITKLKINFIGDTILHYVCKRNNQQLVRFFKKNGADFTVKNSKNQTPIDMVQDPQILQMITGEKIRRQNYLGNKQQCSSTYSFNDCIQQGILQIKVVVFDKNNRKKAFRQMQQKCHRRQKYGLEQLTQKNQLMEKSKIFPTQYQQKYNQHRNSLPN